MVDLLPVWVAMPQPLQSFVLIKQVPDQSSKAGINADGTIDRAKAKRMLNPFDRYALEAALKTKRLYGAEVTAITMGPPPAIEILHEAIAHGADRAVLLSDRRLAASDTLATSYALAKTIQTIADQLGSMSFVFCGLQTTDGDTAQVGPQIAERLGIPQITYCEDFELDLENQCLKARRVIEGGSQTVSTQIPAVLTIANSSARLAYKTLRGARRIQALIRDPEAASAVIQTLNLDDIGADSALCGLMGSPTIVAATEKVGEVGGSCQLLQGQSVQDLVTELLQRTSLQTSALLLLQEVAPR